MGLVALAFASLAQAQDFSADVINQKQGAEGIKKVYSTKDKVRYEVEGQRSAMGPTAVIVDDAQHKFLLVMPQRHMYMDNWPATMKKPMITQLWRVDDVNDACPQWKKVAEQAGSDRNWGSCTKVGSDTVNGRSTVKYEGVSTRGNKQYYWVDTKLHCVIKTQGDGEGIELTNIQEGSQPASLFEIPAGYTKFDMGSMMRQQPQ
jgi:hypothetical protein